ncbi:MAG: sensor histidine kinase [Pseudomonadota bacterium]
MLIWSGLYFGLKQYRGYLQLKQRQRAMDKSLKSASLDALVNQLNPHFMFNTLNNIRALILEDPEAARRALTHLSDMYRYTLNADLTQLVTLDEELEVVTDYLYLMHIQLEERLEINWQVAQECRSLSVPRMMVQLLVENAIKYGISRRQNGGCICIEASCIDHFRIRVINDGKLSNGNTRSTGLGLENLRRRLTLLYENSAGFELREIEGRVIAELTLPCSTERQNDN